MAVIGIFYGFFFVYSETIMGRPRRSGITFEFLSRYYYFI